MIMTTSRDARSSFRLLLIQHRQESENQRNTSVELYAHETLRDGIGDVFEMHGLALDQHANGDDSIEGAGGSGSGACLVEVEGGQVCGRGAEQVAGAEGGGGCGLDLRGGEESGVVSLFAIESSVVRARGAYLEQAMGSSQEPGTDCTTMLDSLTPEASSLAFVPARSGSIIAASCQCGARLEGMVRGADLCSSVRGRCQCEEQSHHAAALLLGL
jgi:hypothetical protein